MYRKLTAPIYIQWEVTPDCNYHCIHCYNAWRETDSFEIPEIDFEEITEKIIQSNVLHVIITGGEPFLVYERIKPCIIKLINHGISVAVNTNASLISRELAEELKKIGISNVLVSLVSAEKEICSQITQHAGAYEKTMNGIRLLCETGNRVSVNMVVTTLNIQDIYMTAARLKELSIKKFYATKASTPCKYSDFTPYRIDSGQLDFMFEELMRIHRDFDLDVGTLELLPYCVFRDSENFKIFGGGICSAGKIGQTITYSGEIKACPHLTAVYGNYKTGILDAWDKMDLLRGETYIPEECSSCKYAVFCSGGCKAEAIVSCGRADKPDPFYCPHNRINFKYEQKEVFKGEYRIVENIKIRKEGHDTYLIYISAFQWLLVGSSMMEFLKIYKNFTYEDMKAAFDISVRDAFKLISQLLKTGIIYEVE